MRRCVRNHGRKLKKCLKDGKCGAPSQKDTTKAILNQLELKPLILYGYASREFGGGDGGGDAWIKYMKDNMKISIEFYQRWNNLTIAQGSDFKDFCDKYFPDR